MQKIVLDDVKETTGKLHSFNFEGNRIDYLRQSHVSKYDVLTIFWGVHMPNISLEVK